jgi:hypothetical protein
MRMSRSIQCAVALLAIAALAAGALANCVCVPPPAARSAHDCCEGGAAPALSAAHDCCGTPSTGAPFVTIAALDTAPAPAIAAAPVAPALAASAPARAHFSSSPPAILRI